jgi:RNA polymerase sigma factor (sigma-70 family)
MVETTREDTEMDDSEIIARVLAGQQEAFSTLVERYQRQLYYFVVGKVAEDTEAKDIVQKSFVSAYQNLRSFQPDGSLFAWLKGIALNHCRNEWRRYHHQSTMKERLLEARRAELELAWLEERHQEGDGRVSALQECMQQLSTEEQALLELRFVQELPLQSIGEQLGKGSEAIRLWLYRVRQRLANCVRRKLSLGGA